MGDIGPARKKILIPIPKPVEAPESEPEKVKEPERVPVPA